MELSMDLWHLNNLKVVTLNYVDCVPQSSQLIKKFLFTNFQKTWASLH